MDDERWTGGQERNGVRRDEKRRWTWRSGKINLVCVFGKFVLHFLDSKRGGRQDGQMQGGQQERAKKEKKDKESINKNWRQNYSPR